MISPLTGLGNFPNHHDALCNELLTQDTSVALCKYGSLYGMHQFVVAPGFSPACADLKVGARVNIFFIRTTSDRGIITLPPAYTGGHLGVPQSSAAGGRIRDPVTLSYSVLSIIELL